MNCDWRESEPKNGRQVFRCARAGCTNSLYADKASDCWAVCRFTCRHLGEQVDTLLVACKTCNGNVRIKYAIHECAKHGRCLPTIADPGGEMMDCGKCSREGLGFEPAP